MLHFCHKYPTHPSPAYSPQRPQPRLKTGVPLMRRVSLALALIVLAVGLAAAPHHLSSRPASAPDFVHFESAHVHPACMTPSGDRLLVVNTPDNRLSVFDLSGGTPSRIGEIFVGMEPVS